MYIQTREFFLQRLAAVQTAEHHKRRINKTEKFIGFIKSVRTSKKVHDLSERGYMTRHMNINNLKFSH